MLVIRIYTSVQCNGCWWKVINSACLETKTRANYDNGCQMGVVINRFPVTHLGWVTYKYINDRCHHWVYYFQLHNISIVSWATVHSQNWVLLLAHGWNFVLYPLQTKITLRLNDAHIRHWTGSSLVQEMTRHLFSAKPFPEPVMILFCLIQNRCIWRSFIRIMITSPILASKNPWINVN